MTKTRLPLHQFKSQRRQDIPFEIGHLRTLPSVAQSPLPHRHTFYEVIWITEGQGRHIIDFEPYPIQADTLYFISPGQVHSWHVEQPLSGYVLLFTDDFLPPSHLEGSTMRGFSFFHRVDHAPILSVAPAAARPFHELCQHMVLEYQGDAYGRLAVLQSSLHIFLIHAQRLYANTTASLAITAAERLVDAYIRLIDLHFHEQQQVHDYADRLGVTPGHLTDTTQQQLGIAAGALIAQRVVLEAKRLLAYSNRSIADIGLRLNFQDPSYFTRYFRRECGQTPTAFRSIIREKYQIPRN